MTLVQFFIAFSFLLGINLHTVLGSILAIDGVRKYSGQTLTIRANFASTENVKSVMWTRKNGNTKLIHELVTIACKTSATRFGKELTSATLTATSGCKSGSSTFTAKSVKGSYNGEIIFTLSKRNERRDENKAIKIDVYAEPTAFTCNIINHDETPTCACQAYGAFHEMDMVFQEDTGKIQLCAMKRIDIHSFTPEIPLLQQYCINPIKNDQRLALVVDYVGVGLRNKTKIVAECVRGNAPTALPPINPETSIKPKPDPEPGPDPDPRPLPTFTPVTDLVPPETTTAASVVVDGDDEEGDIESESETFFFQHIHIIVPLVVFLILGIGIFIYSQCFYDPKKSFVMEIRKTLFLLCENESESPQEKLYEKSTKSSKADVAVRKKVSQTLSVKATAKRSEVSKIKDSETSNTRASSSKSSFPSSGKSPLEWRQKIYENVKTKSLHDRKEKLFKEPSATKNKKEPVKQQSETAKIKESHPKT